MDDLQSDDSKEELANCKRFSSRKRQLESSTSSDEDKHTTPKRDQNFDTGQNQNAASRSSDRIKKRRSKEFSMPTKHEIWNTIPTTTSPEKTYNELKPRKLVNNFTRVTHRYNHDPAYTSDEGDSLDGFLVMEDESSTDTSDSDFYDETLVEDNPRKKKKKHRIKNRRIVQFSSDSDSHEPKTCEPAVDRDDDNVRTRLREKLLKKRCSVDETSATVADATGSGDNEGINLTLRVKKAQVILASSSDDENIQKNNMATSSRSHVRSKRCRRRKSRSVSLSLYESNDSSDPDVNSESEKGDNSPRSNDSSGVKKDNGDDEANSKIENGRGEGIAIVDEDGADTSDSVLQSRKRRRSALGSDSDSDECTTNEEEERGAVSRSVLQSKARKEKRASLFSDFKQARSKLESKNKGK